MLQFQVFFFTISLMYSGNILFIPVYLSLLKDCAYFLDSGFFNHKIFLDIHEILYELGSIILSIVKRHCAYSRKCSYFLQICTEIVELKEQDVCSLLLNTLANK